MHLCQSFRDRGAPLHLFSCSSLLPNSSLEIEVDRFMICVVIAYKFHLVERGHLFRCANSIDECSRGHHLQRLTANQESTGGRVK